MREWSPEKPINILLVEDNVSDVRLIQRATREWRFVSTMHVMRTGDQAHAFLFRAGAYTDAPRPDLILLDLNLPGMDGRELLAEIKEHETLRSIPVVVLSASSSAEDVLQSYQLHANCCIAKPASLSGFVEVMKAVEEFWFTVVRLPPG